MKSLVLDMPAFGFIVATRAALGVGIGLLVADRLTAERRRVVGRALIAIGALTTIPAAMTLSKALNGRGRSAPLPLVNAASRATRRPGSL